MSAPTRQERIAAGILGPEQDTGGHLWRLDEYGRVEYLEPYDPEGGGHAGPTCAVCGIWYCQHCHPDGPPEACEPAELTEQLADLRAELSDRPADQVEAAVQAVRTKAEERNRKAP